MLYVIASVIHYFQMYFLHLDIIQFLDFQILQLLCVQKKRLSMIHSCQMCHPAQAEEQSSQKTLRLLISAPRSPLFMEKKMNYQKNTAELSASERLKLSLILTLTVKLLNHEIALWYFVLPWLRVHPWNRQYLKATIRKPSHHQTCVTAGDSSLW